MHHHLLFLCCCTCLTMATLSPVHGIAQNRINTMIAQILKTAALHRLTQQGYQTDDEGLTLIGNIKLDDLVQHTGHIASLDKVKAVIRQDGRRVEILHRADLIVSAGPAVRSFTNSQANLSAAGKAYIRQVYAGLSSAATDLMARLSNLTEDDRLRMDDQERMTQLAGIYQASEGLFSFFRAFMAGAGQLAEQRRNERVADQRLHQLISK